MEFNSNRRNHPTVRSVADGMEFDEQLPLLDLLDYLPLRPRKRVFAA